MSDFKGDTSIMAFASHVSRVQSPATARKYEEAANKFLKTLKHNGITRFADLPRNVLQMYTDSLVDDYAPASVAVYVAGVKKYLDWSKKQGAPVPDLFEPELPKIVMRTRDALTPDNLKSYLNYADALLTEPTRTAAILLPCSGLRAQEISELPLEAIRKVSIPLRDGRNKNTLALRVVGKGSKERVVPLLDEGVEALLGYLTDWRKKRKGPWVFPGQETKSNRHGQIAMSARTLREGLITVREPLGVKITPHTMRRTYVTTLYRMGVDPMTIAKIVGHDNVQTTFKHYLALDENDLTRAVHSHGGSIHQGDRK